MKISRAAPGGWSWAELAGNCSPCDSNGNQAKKVGGKCPIGPGGRREVVGRFSTFARISKGISFEIAILAETLSHFENSPRGSRWVELGGVGGKLLPMRLQWEPSQKSWRKVPHWPGGTSRSSWPIFEFRFQRKIRKVPDFRASIAPVSGGFLRFPAPILKALRMGNPRVCAIRRSDLRGGSDGGSK